MPTTDQGAFERSRNYKVDEDGVVSIEGGAVEESENFDAEIGDFGEGQDVEYLDPIGGVSDTIETPDGTPQKVPGKRGRKPSK